MNMRDKVKVVLEATGNAEEEGQMTDIPGGKQELVIF